MQPTVFEDVLRFMIACGQIPPETPTVHETELSELYKSLIQEEVSEFWEAEAVANDQEMLDACFDMIWVIVGYMHARGWNAQAAWNVGAASNHSKIDPATGKVIRREDGKILKPVGWEPPNFGEFVIK